MRRNLFWLSEEQWARIEPHLPTKVRGVERVDAESSAGSCMFSRVAAAGVIARPSTGRRRQSITVSCAGRSAGCGRTCSENWPGVGDRQTRR